MSNRTGVLMRRGDEDTITGRRRTITGGGAQEDNREDSGRRWPSAGQPRTEASEGTSPADALIFDL